MERFAKNSCFVYGCIKCYFDSKIRLCIFFYLSFYEDFN